MINFPAVCTMPAVPVARMPRVNLNAIRPISAGTMIGRDCIGISRFSMAGHHGCRPQGLAN